jgi:hypothetical protein
LFEQTMPILDRIQPRLQDEEVATYFSQRDHELLEERQGFTRPPVAVAREAVFAEETGAE